jgi:hypothetical protein
MTNEKDRPKTGEMQDALDSIHEMKRAALWRAIPSHWFGATIALLAGVLVALSVADLREYHVFIIIFMSIVMVYQAQKTGVSARHFPSKLAGIAIGILIPLFFLIIIFAQMYSDILGPVGAPLLAGVVLATSVYVLSIFERRWHLKRIVGRNVNEDATL